MIGLAVIVGIAIGSPDMLFSRLSIYGFITGFSISSYSMIINDVYDIEIDKVNQPERPLPKQLISVNSALSLSLILLLIGLTSSLLISYYHIIITVIFSFLSWFYNIWGKKQGLIGNSIVASSMSIPFIFGGIITGNISLLVWSISLIAFLSGMGREIIKTIAKGENVQIRGFGSFKNRQLKTRIGRNPKDGSRVDIPAKQGVHWKISKELFQKLNQDTNRDE